MIFLAAPPHTNTLVDGNLSGHSPLSFWICQEMVFGPQTWNHSCDQIIVQKPNYKNCVINSSGSILKTCSFSLLNSDSIFLSLIWSVDYFFRSFYILRKESSLQPCRMNQVGNIAIIKTHIEKTLSHSPILSLGRMTSLQLSKIYDSIKSLAILSPSFTSRKRASPRRLFVEFLRFEVSDNAGRNGKNPSQ